MHSSVQCGRPLRLPEHTAAVRRQRSVTHGVDMTADCCIDAPLLSPLLVRRDACPSLFGGEAGAWRGRRRRGGGGWTAVAAAEAAGAAAARAARGAYSGSRRTRCRCVRGRKSAVSSGRSMERQWRGSRDCKAKEKRTASFVQSCINMFVLFKFQSLSCVFVECVRCDVCEMAIRRMTSAIDVMGAKRSDAGECRNVQRGEGEGDASSRQRRRQAKER